MIKSEVGDEGEKKKNRVERRDAVEVEGDEGQARIHKARGEKEQLHCEGERRDLLGDRVHAPQGSQGAPEASRSAWTTGRNENQTKMSDERF